MTGIGRVAAVVAAVLVVVSGTAYPVVASPGTGVQRTDAGRALDGADRTITGRADQPGGSGGDSRGAVVGVSRTGAPSRDHRGNTGHEPWFLYLQGVNAANGNLFLSREDISIGARGGPLRIVRSYNSHLSDEHGSFGFGWTHNYDMELIERDDGSVVFVDASGSAHRFTREDDGYEAPPGIHSRLTRNDSGYVLRRTDGRRLLFNATGVLTGIQDSNGNRVHLEYAGGRLTAVRDDSGQRLRLRYTENGRIGNITDPLNRTVEYRYEAGDLAEVVDPLGESTGYVYYANHKLKGVLDGSAIVRTVSYYAGSDRVRCTRSGLPAGEELDSCAGGFVFDYDYANDTVEVLNDLTGNTTSITLNGAGSPTRIRSPLRERQFVWDADRNLLETTNETGTYTFDYDRYGNLIERTRPSNGTVRFGWRTVDTENRYISLLMNRTDVRGHTWRFRYDGEGNRVKVINPLGETRHIGYDEFGFKVNETDFAGHLTRYTYTAQGFRTAIVDPSGRATNFSYNAVGWRTARTDGRNNTYRFEYDARGVLVRMVDPSGNETTFEYEGGHLVSVTNAKGRTIEASAFEPASRDVELEVDGRGNLASISTANHSITRESDARGRVTSTTVDYGPFDKTINYTYDPAGNLVEMETPGGTRRYEYDALGRLIRIEGPNGTWANYTYNAAGRRTKAVYSNGATTTREYDDAGNLLALRTEAGNGTTVLDRSYTYDAAGNRITVTDGDGNTTRFEYDRLDRLAAVTYPSGETVRYAYDAVGNRIARVVNDTRRANATARTDYTYGFDDELLEAGAVTYEYDAAGNLIEEDANGSVTRYGYDAGGRLATVAPPDGENVSFTYLPDGARASKTVANGTTYYLYSTRGGWWDAVAAFDENGSLERQYLQGPGTDEPLGLVRDGRAYLYHVDERLNVRALTDSNGEVVNRYRYGAFGRVRSETEAVANPYRFAGRRFDERTGLYYNRMRYYDPSVGRFTRRDPAGVRGGVNPYTYAFNNPIEYHDPSGLAPDLWTYGGIGGGVGAALGWGWQEQVVQNQFTRQVCHVRVFLGRVGLYVKAEAGIELGAFTGPDCGADLGGVSKYYFANVVVAEIAVQTNFKGISISGSFGFGGAVGIGYLVVGVEVQTCDCPWTCPECPACEQAKDECNDGDDDDPPDDPPDDGDGDGGPGGDHPDDNHDRSVLSYTTESPNFTYDQDAEVAVFTRGFSAELTDLLLDLGERPASVGLRTTQEELDRHEVLVIPTGGLFGLSSLSSLEEKLERYVEGGGTLVVFPQQRGYEFEPVPGNLSGYGWREDQSCQFGSVGIAEFCSVLASLEDDTADINVDGYFTEYPENATVLLSRTKNGQPSMLTYHYGEGRVFATTAYTDWASGHHADTGDGRTLLRDVLTQSKQPVPSDIPIHAPGENVTHSVNVTSYVDMTADGVQVRLIGPSGEVETTVDVSTSLSRFETRNVSFTAGIGEDAPLGIWTVEYSLVNDSHGEVQRVERDEVRRIDRERPFAVSVFNQSGEGWIFQDGNITVSVTSDAERYPWGTNATFRITAHNRGERAQNVTVWWSLPHNYREAWFYDLNRTRYGVGGTDPGQRSPLHETLKVPAKGQRSIIHRVPVVSFDRLWAEFYRGNASSGDYLGRASRGFFVFDPAVDVAVDTDRKRYGREENVTVDLKLNSQAALNASVDVAVVDPRNDLVFHDRLNATVRSDDPGNDSCHPYDCFDTSLEFAMPSDPESGVYAVLVDVSRGDRKIGFGSAQFTVPDVLWRIAPSIPRALRNDSAIAFTVANVGVADATNATFDASLVDPAGTEVWTGSETFDLRGRNETRLEFAMDASRLLFGEYRLEYGLTDKNGTRRIERVRTLSNSVTASMRFDRPFYRVREEARANLTVTNDGRFVQEDLRVETAVPDAGFNDSDRLALTPGENATVEYAIGLPSDLAPGKHTVEVTFGLGDATTRRFSVFVPESKLTLTLGRAEYDVGDTIVVGVANVGGVDTEADCSLAVYGPRGTRLSERQRHGTIRAGGNTTLALAIPGQATSGFYFLSATCENARTNTTAKLTKSFDVVGLDADAASTTNGTVFTGGTNVTITTDITNHDGAIENATLRLEVLDTSAPSSSSFTSTDGASATDSTRRAGPASEARTSRRNPRDSGPNAGRARGNSTNGTDPPGPFVSGPWNATTGADLRNERTFTATATAPNTTIGNETVWTDRVVVLSNRSLVVNATGDLTLRNTTLVFNNSADLQAGIEVLPGGELHVLAGSTITARNDTFRSAVQVPHYFFQVRSGAAFEVRDSAISEVGIEDRRRPEEVRGVYVAADDAVIENSSFERNAIGLVLNATDNVTVTDSNVSLNGETGIHVLDSTSTRIEGNALIRNAEFGIALRDSEDTTVIGNAFDNWDEGIYLARSQSNEIAGNRFSGFDLGVLVYNSTHNALTDNDVSASYSEIELIGNANFNTVTNNTFDGEGSRIVLRRSDANNVSDNVMSEESSLIWLDFDADDNTLIDNDVFGAGITIGSSNNVTLIGNDLSGPYPSWRHGYGLNLSFSHNVTLIDNDITETGISIVDSRDATVTGNDVSGHPDGYGLYLSSSRDATLRNNTVVGDGTNAGGGWNDLLVEGDGIRSFDHDIDTSNRATGGPIHYLVNRSGATVPAGAGATWLVNNTDVTVRGGGFTALVLTNDSRIENVSADRGRYGLYLLRSNDNTIVDSEATNNTDGVYLERSSFNRVVGTDVSDSRNAGVYGRYANNTTVRDGAVTNNSDGIRLERSHFATIDRTNVSANRDRGIDITTSDYSTITDSQVTHNAHEAILVRDGEHTTVAGSNLSFNARGGISLVRSDFGTVTNNGLVGNGLGGIELRHSDSTDLIDNTVDRASWGIRIRRSRNATLTANDVSRSRIFGIGFESSPNVTMADNVLVEDGLVVEGSELRHYRHDIDTSNTVHGGPLYYWINRSDETVPADAGAAWLVNSHDMTVTGGHAAALVFTDDTTVENVTASDNQYGVYLGDSDNNTVRDSHVANNTYGVYLAPVFGVRPGPGSYNNTITGVDASASANANIYVDESDLTTLRNNTASDSAFGSGIVVRRSDSIRLEGNRIDDNSENGIELRAADSATVVANRVINNSNGIELRGADFADVTDNVVADSRYGGFRMGQSIRATLRNNTMGAHFDVEGRDIDDFLHDIDTSNTVDGTPLYYWVDRSDATVPEDAESIWLVNATDIAVRGGSDVNLIFTQNSTVENVTALGVRDGIYLLGSDNNTVTGSRVTDSPTGISLSASDQNMVSEVAVEDGGVSLSEASGNVLSNVDVTDSTWNGIVLLASSDNVLSNVSVADNDRNGIELIRASDNDLSNVEATNNTENGIEVRRDARDNVLSNVEATDSAENGIALFDATNNTLVEYDASGNRLYGVVVRGLPSSGDDPTDNDLLDGTVTGNGFGGIRVVNAHETRIANSTVTDNGRRADDGPGFGILLSDASDNLIYNNYVDNPGAVNAVDDWHARSNAWNTTRKPGTNIVGGPFLGGNFWGDYNGTDLDRDLIGDTRLPYNASGDIRHGGDFLPLVEPTRVGGRVVWSETTRIDVPANATRTVETDVPSDVLEDVTGKLKLSTTLTSSTDQPIASEDPSFYVIDGNTSLTMETDERIATPEESVRVFGEVTNDGDTTQQYNLSVWKDDTEVVADSFDLAPGETHRYAITTSSAASFTLRATVRSEVDAVTVEDTVEVTEPEVNATLLVPDVVGRTPFDVGLLVENTGGIATSLDASIVGGSARTVTLAPGEFRLLETSMELEANATVAATLAGDLNRTLERTVTFGEDARITASPQPVYSEGEVEIPYAIENTGQLETRFNATFAVDGRTIEREVFLPPGEGVSESLLVNLTAGEYTLTATSPFGENETTFTVAERNQLRLDAALPANVTNDTLQMAVMITNVGPNDVHGTLVANSTAFLEREEFTVGAGENTTRTLTIGLPGEMAAGERLVSIQAVTDGSVVAERTASFSIARPRFELVSVPANRSFGSGERASLNVTVANTGGAQGEARLNATVPGIFQSEETAWIAPGNRTNVTVGFTVPDDLAEGSYPVEFDLDDAHAETSIFVRGAKVNVTAALDRRLYEAGENATLTLRVENERAVDAELLSRVKFNDYDVVENYSLAGGETETLSFEVPVRFDGDEKVFYSVYTDSGRSLYIDGIRPHRNRSANVTVYTDEPVYDIGEAATIRVAAHASGEVAVSAPGFSWRETLSAGATRNLSVTVPALRSGTYFVHYAFENRSHSYAFDVDGYHDRVSEATLERAHHVEGEAVALALTLESSRAVDGRATVRIRDVEDRVLDTTRLDVSLRAGTNEMTVEGDLPANTSGIHSIGYRFATNTTPAIPLTSGAEFFEVHERPEPAFAYAPVEPGAGENVTFDAAGSTAPGGSIAAYEWDLDGDGSVDATGPTVTHAFGSAGNYSVRLTVIDDNGVRASVIRTVTVAATATTCIDGAVAGDDRRIGLTEIQQAINWWAEDRAVPGTGGETISLGKIQSLVNAWAEDTTVSCDAG